MRHVFRVSLCAGTAEFRVGNRRPQHREDKPLPKTLKKPCDATAACICLKHSALLTGAAAVMTPSNRTTTLRSYFTISALFPLPRTLADIFLLIISVLLGMPQDTWALFRLFLTIISQGRSLNTVFDKAAL